MLNIQGTNVEVTDALREHVEEQSQKIEQYNSISVDVHLTVESTHDFKCKVITNNISTESTAQDMYNAITEAFEKAHTVLEKKKQKALTKRHEKASFEDIEIED